LRKVPLPLGLLGLVPRHPPGDADPDRQNQRREQAGEGAPRDLLLPLCNPLGIPKPAFALRPLGLRVCLLCRVATRKIGCYRRSGLEGKARLAQQGQRIGQPVAAVDRCRASSRVVILFLFRHRRIGAIRCSDRGSPVDTVQVRPAGLAAWRK
jgi:hypothetical protein